MTADVPPSSLERLLAERAWISALARTLVRDPAAADDAVQDVYVAALRSPPREVSRGWLASVLRNAVRMRARAESRRDLRERGAARREAASPGDIVVRAEEHRRVVDAVLALDEPYRTTVLLRFFDDVSVPEIAARTGVPLETAKARLRRAIERLRGRLDDEHGGDGVAWRAALVPLTVFAGPRGLETAATGGAGASASSSLTNGVLVMAAGKTVLTVAGALLVGGAVGWLAMQGTVDEERTKSAALAPVVKERDDARDAVKSLRAEVQRAHDATSSLDGRIRELENALRDEKAAREKAEAAIASAAVPVETKAPRKHRYSFPAADEVLASLDWDAIGEHMGAMPPLLLELVDLLREGKTPDQMSPETAGKIGEHNAPLVTAALKISSKIPGSNVNGSFTHPAFMSNVIVSALQTLGLPLTDAQSTKLGEIGQRYAQEDEQRLARYDDATFQIRKVSEEADLRERFFQEARTILSPEQVDALSPPAVRDRMQFDLYSSGVFLYLITRPVPYPSAEAFSNQVSKSVVSSLKLDEAQAAKAKEIVAEWTAALPKELTAPTSDPLDKIGVLHSWKAVRGSVETRKLVERLAGDLQLQGDSLAGAKRMGTVLVPLPKSE